LHFCSKSSGEVPGNKGRQNTVNPDDDPKLIKIGSLGITPLKTKSVIREEECSCFSF
jgi:hypothetical protein